MLAPGLPDRGDPITVASSDGETPDRLAFPIALPPGASPFVGRAGELAALAAPWTRAVDTSQRRVVLVGGDPGVGKSRLAAEFARECYEAGATVLFGRCYEENVVPYQPFVEAIEQYLRHGDSSEVRADLVRSGTLLARLVPDIALRFPDLPEPIRAEPDTERYLMFEAVDALLAGIAKRSPLLVVVDDLHWADRPTLALLRHLACHTEAAPLAVLATYRTGRSGRRPPAATGHRRPPPRRRVRGGRPRGLDRARGRRAHRRDVQTRAPPRVRQQRPARDRRQPVLRPGDLLARRRDGRHRGRVHPRGARRPGGRQAGDRAEDRAPSRRHRTPPDDRRAHRSRIRSGSPRRRRRRRRGRGARRIGARMLRRGSSKRSPARSVAIRSCTP